MRGSQWNKWNVHVHTKGTNKNDQFVSRDMDTFFEVFFKKAFENNVKAIGITDYFSVDNYIKAKQFVTLIHDKVDGNGNKLFTEGEINFINEIFIFPNVELRMLPSTDSGRLINIHCIFNPDYVSELENDFFNTIENQDRYKMNRAGFIAYGKSLKSHLNNDDLFYKEGLNNFTVDPGSVKTLIDKNTNFKNNTVIVVSNSNKDGNSGLQKHYDMFEGETGSLDGVRRTIYYLSNAIFSANAKDISYFLGKRLDDTDGITEDEKIAERLKVLTERGSFKACLVGCDAHTEDNLFKKFTWIKASLNFSGLRQIIYEPEQRVKIQNTEPDLKEDKLIIDQVRFITVANEFPPEPIQFNRNLNVIVGGKSSGKSILLYNIAKTLLADRKILSDFKYDFGADFNFEVRILSGQTQNADRHDDMPSILSEIKYIPQNYLSKLAEPENKKGNELLKLVRGLLLEDDDYNNKYQLFVNRLKSNDLNREAIINNYFELKTKIADLKKQLTQKGDESVLVQNIALNNSKITKLKEGAGLSEEQIAQYNAYNASLEAIELEIRKIRSDHSKITTFNTDAKNVINELIQRKNLLLSSLEDEEIKKYYTSAYNGLDELLVIFNKLIGEIELDESRAFKTDNIFKSQFKSRAKRSQELKDLLQPYVKNLELKTEIEALEKLVMDDKQRLNAINQVKVEIKNNEDALQKEKTKLFTTYSENFEEYNTIIKELADRTELLKSDNLQIVGRPCFNFPKLRNKIFEISDGRSASYNNYPLFNEDKIGTALYTITELSAELLTVFNALVENRTYVLNSRFDAKAAIKILMDDYFFDYWDVIYDSDELAKMSTGKASFVILMLIVGLSKSKAPILIDQPEDNLDNRSITKDLVEYLRNKKLERQIILVTHNANVVVNADAENVIIANQKGQNDKVTTSPYQFDYINGPIENTKPYNKNQTDLLKCMGVREHIAEILEGGKEAFKKRERKYGFEN